MTLSIENNPGIAAVLVYIYYDASAFTMDPSRDLSVEGAFASGGLMGNTIEKAKANGRYDGAEGKAGVLALWYNGSGQNVTDDGAMLSVRLKALDGAADGDYEIGVGYSPGNTANQDLEKVSFSTIGGTVTVSGGSDVPQKPTGETENPGTTAPSATSAPDTTAETAPAALFTDVSGSWAEESIKDAADRGLIVGDRGLYRPNDAMSRAELATILWRANGSPAPADAATFTDLTQDWYRDPVAWAEDVGVVNGVGGGKFDPAGIVTREQLAAVLHRMAGSPTGLEAMLTIVYDGAYPDSGEISGWAKPSLYWTIYNGIYCGESAYTSSNGLAPKKAADRAQIAVMIVHYLEKMEKGAGV